MGLEDFGGLPCAGPPAFPITLSPVRSLRQGSESQEKQQLLLSHRRLPGVSRHLLVAGGPGGLRV